MLLSLQGLERESQGERLDLLLEALGSGAIEVGALDWAREEKLLSHPDAQVAARATELLGEAGRDREKAV